MRTKVAALFVLPSCSLIPRLAMGGEAEFLQLVSEVEANVLEMAREVELLYKDRCSDVTLRDCSQNNYEECLSTLPDSFCPESVQLADNVCGDGTTCSRLWDYSTSRVSLPEDVADGVNGNPTDPEVIETICFSQKLDAWFMDKTQQVSDFWKSFGLETPPMYFGAHNGAFRIYPGYRASNCGGYDPRLRPWYIAASSGPKNVLLILDVSGSMNQFGKLERLKTAAKRVVSTLTVADRVAVVPFESVPTQVIARDETYMYTATDENKAKIIFAIDALVASGQTNFYDAFKKGFDIFEATLEQEFNVDCNSAVLFLTDGRMSDGLFTEEQVIDYVKDRAYGVNATLGHHLLMFTYSVSEDASVDTFPRDLSCAVETGVWSKIETEEEIVDSLSSYYQLFASGLGANRNEDFTAWVEPYEYAVGGVLGTTVAAPVYDCDKDPHLFLGVVGIDFRLSAVNAALEGDDNKNGLDRIVRQSTAKCPSLELTLCQLESFRHRGSAGDEALCTNSCTQNDFVEIEPIKCDGQHDYPVDLWANIDEEGLSYEERACCLVGETIASEKCPSSSSSGSSSNIAVIIGGVVGGVICVMLLGGLILWHNKRHSTRDSSDPEPCSLRKTPPIPPPSHNPEYKPSAPVEQPR